MKIEQKQHEFTLFLPINGKFVNKNDFLSKTPKKNSHFVVVEIEEIKLNLLEIL